MNQVLCRDVLIIIFDYVDFKTLLVCRSVSKYVKRLLLYIKHTCERRIRSLYNLCPKHVNYHTTAGYSDKLFSIFKKMKKYNYKYIN